MRMRTCLEAHSTAAFSFATWTAKAFCSPKVTAADAMRSPPVASTRRPGPRKEYQELAT